MPEASIFLDERLYEVRVDYGFFFDLVAGFVVVDPPAIVAPVQVAKFLWLEVGPAAQVESSGA